MDNKKKLLIIISHLLLVLTTFSQSKNIIWNPDNGDGTYTNPIIFADYSDPDAIRVGDDFYMVSSSFGHFPGLPILHSKDLINWELIGHAAQNYPFPEFEKPQHGFAIWAPSIRYHNGEFYIYFGDPDRGVFMTKAKNPAGPWSPLACVLAVTGWIDCCPFWDEDGNAYLAHAFANSRSGIKSVLGISKMSPDGEKVFGNSTLVFNGQKDHPTMEGPKMYKRNGYYYIFAPAGGVKPGWQTILRSKNIYGPYEDKIVLEQGSTNINGPHQGAWVTTQTGEDWFLHFQDRYAYGRIVHLQPMKWENDWPVMGEDYDGNGIGEPVATHKKPNVGKSYPVQIPQTSDEFDDTTLGLQWQWQSNFKDSWCTLSECPGSLRLFSEVYSDEDKNLWNIGRILMQKMPALEFAATTKLQLNSTKTGEKCGLIVFGRDYSYISIEKGKDSYQVAQIDCLGANNGSEEVSNETKSISENEIYFKVEVKPDNPEEVIPVVTCIFSYSLDGKIFHPLGKRFTASAGQWVGAKVGLFSIAPKNTKEPAYTDIDWFRISKF